MFLFSFKKYPGRFKNIKKIKGTAPGYAEKKKKLIKKTIKMDGITKRSDLVFGKFLKHKISDLSAIKGGAPASQTQTTRSTSYESTFDSDQEIFIENIKDRES